MKDKKSFCLSEAVLFLNTSVFIQTYTVFIQVIQINNNDVGQLMMGVLI